MKSLFISLLALLLCVSASAQKRITINEGEALVGFYNTDELPAFNEEGASVAAPYAGTAFAGVVFNDDVVGRYVGGELVRYRFALASRATVYRALVYKVPVIKDSYFDLLYSELVAEVDLSRQEIVVGWNDVELPEPLPIEDADYHYMLGYEYEQVSGVSPLAVDKNLSVDFTPSWGGIVIHENGNWENNTGCSLCVQAVVSGGDGIIAKDISLLELSTDDTINDTNDVEYSFKIRSSGSSTIRSYTLRVTLDGEEVETLSTPVALTSSYQTISRTIPSEDLAYGEHTLAVSVVDIEGSAPTANTEDDYVEKSFVLYASQIVRQMHLIEHMTSVWCQYCPLSDEMIELMQENNPDKYAWIAYHYNMSSSDPYYISKASYLNDYSGLTGYPDGIFDRSLCCYYGYVTYTYRLAVNIGYSTNYNPTAARLINQCVDDFYEDIEPYATVDIDSEYNSSTRKLTVKVSGIGVKGAQDLLKGNVLTVCLTEDGLVYRQSDQNSTITNYVHNNVLRDIITDYAWGDDINWTSDRTYENTYTCTLNSGWTADNMHIVAFISGPMRVYTNSGWVYNDIEEAYLRNANMAKLGESSTISGVEDVVPEPEADPEPDPEPTVDPDPETEPGPAVDPDPDPSESDGISTVGNDVTISSYYTADGYRIDAPVKGVNIVKLSDGSMRKIVVR